MTLSLARLDGTRLMDGAAVEQQLLGQRGLTGVRVRNDGKGASALHFLRDVLHGDLLSKNR